MYHGEPHRKELDGLFGMCEMECCVELMLQKSENTGVPFNQLQMRPDEFSADTLVGFCQLLAHGYIVPLYPNMYFGIGEETIKRMRTRGCWKAMGDAVWRPSGPINRWGRIPTKQDRRCCAGCDSFLFVNEGGDHCLDTLPLDEDGKPRVLGPCEAKEVYEESDPAVE